MISFAVCVCHEPMIEWFGLSPFFLQEEVKLMLAIASKVPSERSVLFMVVQICFPGNQRFYHCRPAFKLIFSRACSLFSKNSEFVRIAGGDDAIIVRVYWHKRCLLQLLQEVAITL